MAIRLAKRFRIVRQKCPMHNAREAQDALPTPLAADESSGGLGVKMVFERIVWPDGRRLYRSKTTIS